MFEAIFFGFLIGLAVGLALGQTYHTTGKARDEDWP